MRAYRLAIMVWGFVGILFIGVLIPTPVYIIVYKEAAEYAQQHYDSHGDFEGAVFWSIIDTLFSAAFWTAVATIAIAWFTRTLKRSTDRLWGAGEKQRRLYEETAERQLRAYVIIDGAAIMNVASGHTPKAVIDFKNFGQTPAYNVTHWQVITKPQIFRQSDDPFRLPPADLYRSSAIIGPTSGMKMLSTAKRHLTEEEFTGLADGTLAMYVFGEIRYRDAFGGDRFMRYRRMLGGHTGVEGNRLAATQYPDEAN